MKAEDGTFRLGVLNASPPQLVQIETLCAAFRKQQTSVDAITEVGNGGHDVYLVVIDVAAMDMLALESLVEDAGLIPLLAILTSANDAMAEKAADVGFCDCLALEDLNVKDLERSVRFANGRRRVLKSIRARESALIEAHERQIQQMATALHDGPMQELVGARFLIGALGAGDATADVQESLQATLQSLRSLCSELKPPAIGPFGLEKALRAHMHSFQTQNPGINVSLEIDNEQVQMPEWARYALFRIYQAAVDNVAKHAHATELRLRWRLDEEYIHLSMADDGEGFEVPSNWLDFARTARYGLLIMHERADALHGRMMVQSSLGSGTRVTLQVPLDQPPLPLMFPTESLVSSPPLSAQKPHITPSIKDRNG